MRRVSAALVGVAGLALVALGMAGSGAGPAHALTNCTVADYSLDSEEQAFLGLINAYRQQNGLNTLTVSTNLNRDATWMVNDLATNNYFSHTDSLGRSAYQRAVDCGYPQGAGENLAAGSSWNTAQSAFDAWKASPGHNANMLFQYYQQIGIARLNKPGSTYGWYWATEFGAMNDGTGGAPAPTNTPTPMPPTATPTPAQNTPTPVPGNPPSGGGSSTATPTPNSLGQAPPSANTPSSGVVTITPTRTSTPTPGATPTDTPAPSLALSAGANLVSWPGGDVEPGVAFKNDPAILAVYSWDASNRTWLHFGPGLPGFVNTLTLLHQGEPYWVIAKSAAALVVGGQ